MAENNDNCRRIYLENTQNGDGEFWECTVDGRTYTVRYGGLGERVTNQSKTLNSHEAAINEMNKVSRNKLRYGYVEVNQRDMIRED